MIGSSSYGGAETSLLNSIKYINKEKFNIFLLCPPDGPMVNKFSQYAKVYLNHHINEKKRVDNFIYLYNFLKEKNISIIHTNHFNPDYFGLLSAFIAKVPVRLSTVHGINFYYVKAFGFKRIHYFLLSFLYTWFYLFSTRLICTSESVKKHLVTKRGLKLSSDKLTVVHNSFDFDYVTSIKENQRTDLKQAAVIANFDMIKGHYEFIKKLPLFFKKKPDWKIIFCGEGKEKMNCWKMVNELKLNNSVEFCCMYDDVLGLIGQSSFTLLPSYIESLSMAILESMALKKPVIAYDTGGNSEIINSSNGILVPKYNTIQFIKEMIDLSRQPEKITSLGNRAFHTVKRNFNLKIKINELEEIYDQQLNYFT